MPPCFRKYRRENFARLAPSQHSSLMVPRFNQSIFSIFALRNFHRSISAFNLLASLKFRRAQHQPASPRPNPLVSPDHPASLAQLAGCRVASAAYPPFPAQLAPKNTWTARSKATLASPSLSLPSSAATSLRDPRTLFPASASEKFSRFSSAPVFTHVSALSEYPVGGWHWYRGSPMRPTQRTNGIGVSTSVPSARTEDTTNSNGVFTFARYASRDQNSGE